MNGYATWLVLTAVNLTAAQDLNGGAQGRNAAIYAHLYYGTVLITGQSADGKGIGFGTGFLYQDNATVVTCAHVIEQIKGNPIQVEWRGHQRQATKFLPETLLQGQRGHDVALLKLESPMPKNAVPLSLHQNDKFSPAPFQELYMLGNPSLLTNTADVARVRNIVTTAGLERAQRIEEARLIAESRRKGEDENVQRRLLLAANELASALYNSDTVFFMLNVPAVPGSSGSPVVDDHGQVVGLFSCGLDHGRIGLNFCVSHIHIRLLDPLGAFLPLRLVRGGLVRRDDFQAGGILLRPDANLAPVAPGEPRPIQALKLLEIVPNHEVFQRFFNHPNNPLNAHDREGVRVTLTRNARISHVVNAVEGFGLLVPSGFEIKERNDPNTDSYTCDIGRPNSPYRVRIYRGPRLNVPRDKAGQHALLNAKVRSYESNRLGIDPVEPPRQPAGEREAVPGPLSMPFNLRDRVQGDLGTSHEWIQPQPGKGLIKEYEYTLCMHHQALEVTGRTYPLAARFAMQHPAELYEIEFILFSMYDTRFGAEGTKNLKFDQTRLYPEDAQGNAIPVPPGAPPFGQVDPGMDIPPFGPPPGPPPIGPGDPGMGVPPLGPPPGFGPFGPEGPPPGFGPFGPEGPPPGFGPFGPEGPPPGFGPFGPEGPPPGFGPFGPEGPPPGFGPFGPEGPPPGSPFAPEDLLQVLRSFGLPSNRSPSVLECPHREDWACQPRKREPITS